MYAFDIIRHVQGDFQLLAQIADMVVDGLSGVVAAVLLPDQVYNHFIDEHPALIGNQQGQNIKLFGRQVDALAAHLHRAVFQTKDQIFDRNNRQRLALLNGEVQAVTHIVLSAHIGLSALAGALMYCAAPR